MPGDDGVTIAHRGGRRGALHRPVAGLELLRGMAAEKTQNIQFRALDSLRCNDDDCFLALARTSRCLMRRLGLVVGSSHARGRTRRAGGFEGLLLEECVRRAAGRARAFGAARARDPQRRTRRQGAPRAAEGPTAPLAGLLLLPGARTRGPPLPDGLDPGLWKNCGWCRNYEI
jgi:hypothetical protein